MTATHQPTVRAQEMAGSPLRAYLRRSNEPSLAHHAKVALVTGLLARRRGMLGFGLRRAAYPWLFARASRPVIAEDVVVRGFGRTELGDGAVIEQNVVLDCKTDHPAGLAMGDACTIRTGAMLDTGYEGFIRIGDRVVVGANCEIRGAGGVDIGDNAMLANGVVVVAGEHTYADPTTPITDQGVDAAPVVIGADVWLGAHVVVTGGVTIGYGAIIGANAVVTRDIPAGAIAVGIPARVVRMRPGMGSSAGRHLAQVP